MKCWKLCSIWVVFLFFGAIPVFSQTGQSIFNSPTTNQELARVPAPAPSRTHIMATFFMGENISSMMNFSTGELVQEMELQLE